MKMGAGMTYKKHMAIYLIIYFVGVGFIRPVFIAGSINRALHDKLLPILQISKS